MIYLANAISLVIQVISILILVDVIGSWLVSFQVRLPNWGFEILRIVHTLTAPILDPIRRLMPNMGLDFSPIIALLLLQVIGNLIIGMLRSY